MKPQDNKEKEHILKASKQKYYFQNNDVKGTVFSRVTMKIRIIYSMYWEKNNCSLEFQIC